MKREENVQRELPAKAALLKQFIDDRKTITGMSSESKARSKIKIGANIFPRWLSRKDRSGTDGHFTQIISGIKSLDLETKLSKEHFDDEYDKYQFGELLHYSWQEVEKICDRERYKNIYPGKDYYHTEPVADRIIKNYKGIYKVAYWNAEKRLVKSKLRIRYSLKVKNKAWAVRCKFHMFFKGDDKGDHKLFLPYDGTIMSCGNFIYFYFMSVSKKRPDLRDMVTIICKDKPGANLEGILTSTNTNNAVYSSPVALIKVSDSDELENSNSRRPIMDVMRHDIGYALEDKAPSYLTKNKPLTLALDEKPELEHDF